MAPYAVIGQSVPRIDALDKVTGRALYSADVYLPGMLHARILRSPHPHARIVKLDITSAEQLKGVGAVVTALDVPSQRVRRAMPDARRSVFAQGKAVFYGQPVAAVAATSPEVAQAALDLIRVEYEPLPVVADAAGAVAPGAPLLHPDMRTEGLAGTAASPSNVATHVEFERGDVAAGFRAAALVLEQEFRTQTVHQGYMEPRAAVAEPGPDGKLTVWASSQGSFTVRQSLAEVLDLPLTKLRVVPVEVGGGFGGKNSLVAAPICALLALKAGRPVKLVLTREEDFTSGRPAPAAVVRLKIGSTRDGRITAVSGSVTYDCGAYPVMIAAQGIVTGLGHYRFPHLKLDGYSVVTNRPPAGSYRAPGTPQVNFAIESLMDMLAERLGMDPIALRLLNIARAGDPMPNDVPFPRIGFEETLEKLASSPAYTAPLKGKHRGRGVACGYWLGGVGSSAAHVNVNTDGSITLVTGSIDLTGTRTTLAQIVAEEMGIPLGSVVVVTADTDTAPYSDITAGSRTTHQVGTAVALACRDVKTQLAQRAAAKLGVTPAEIEWAGGRLRVKAAPDRSVTMADLARASVTSADGALTGRGAVGMPARVPTFSAHVVDMEVDPDTGKARVLRYTIAQDAGLVVNPVLVEGQMQGGVGQGIGWAMSEGYVFERGVPRNTSLLDYRLPTSLDVPFIETLLVEVPCPTNMYGIRGVGEAPLVPALATIANAVCRAAGTRMTELPLTPERIFWDRRRAEVQERS